MNAILSISCVGLNSTYQHIQGIMLVQLNKLAQDLNLSHAEYRILATLISLWNKKKGMAFPTINYLSVNCKMAKSTVLKILKKLVILDLIVVVKSSGRRNNYLLTNKLLPELYNGSTIKLPFGFHEELPNKIELINKQNINNNSINNYKSISIA
ncbi:MAG: helix-turn-helix domain-containing protein [Cyanobacteriota bacterium]